MMYRKSTFIQLAVLLGLASTITAGLVPGGGLLLPDGYSNITVGPPNSTLPRPPPASSSPPAPGSPHGFTPKRRASLDVSRTGQPVDLKKRAGFNASTASLDDYASNALEVAKSRIANSSTCTAENLKVRKLW